MAHIINKTIRRAYRDKEMRCLSDRAGGRIYNENIGLLRMIKCHRRECYREVWPSSAHISITIGVAPEKRRLPADGLTTRTAKAWRLGLPAAH